MLPVISISRRGDYLSRTSYRWIKYRVDVTDSDVAQLGSPRQSLPKVEICLIVPPRRRLMPGFVSSLLCPFSIDEP